MKVLGTIRKYLRNRNGEMSSCYGLLVVGIGYLLGSQELIMAGLGSIALPDTTTMKGESE